jgi:hypothetical protein
MLWVYIYRHERDYDRDVMSVNVVIEFNRGEKSCMYIAQPSDVFLSDGVYRPAGGMNIT